MQIGILYEDKDIAVIHKPAGIAVQTGQIGRQDVVSELKNHCAAADGCKERNRQPFIGVVHRLDQPVEGILVFGKTPEATASLNKQLSGEGMHKKYYAVVCGQVPGEEGELVDYLYKDTRSNTSRVIEKEEQKKYPDAKKAVLSYRLLARTEEAALLAVFLQTGRHHQIRVQMSHAGMPLMGDSKYSSPGSAAASVGLGAKDVALCAYYLKFIHPTTKKQMEYTVSPSNPVFQIFKNVL